jgi:triosephosphate isomerase
LRKKLVAGNWKMNGTRSGIADLISDLVDGVRDIVQDQLQVAVFPPFVFLDQVSQALEGSSILLGGQNADWRAQGAVSGEIHPSMLKEMACTYCLVGHSERRGLFAETDSQVARKFRACSENQLSPILCVGETLQEREAGQTLAVVSRQIDAVIDEFGIAGIAQGLIAYEPVWAIGTGMSATPEQAEQVHGAIRDRLSQSDQGVADNIQILYGGSVNADNAEGLFEKENIDGALVGGASLVSADFISICMAAADRVDR